jgi:hypothetical protein
VPNLDGGHYFLTVLAPVRTEQMPDLASRQDPNRGYSRSHRLILAQRLALLPTGRQDGGLPDEAWPSPFSRNSLNHFARMAIVDAPHFNGRISGDGLAAAVLKTQLLKAQPDDRLSTPFLLFGADFDAQGLSEAQALRRYTDQLWETMSAELTSIFEHCYGFENVNNAASFHAYICKCQVETSRPFNDYWADGLKAGNMWPALILVGLGAVVAAACLGAWLIGLLVLAGGWLLKMQPLWPPPGHLGTVGWLIGLPLAGLFIGFVTLKLLHLFGKTPFPTTPDADLPSVLKGLYLQQHFTHLAIDAQGMDDNALHARFGAFLKSTRPSDLAQPTLKPGAAQANTREVTK